MVYTEIMKTFESEKVKLNKPAATVYGDVSDFTKLGMIMPSQIGNWTATTDTCSFNIQGMASLHMEMEERKPSEYVRMRSGSPTPVTFSIEVFLEASDANSCHARFVIKADLNPMLSMMLEKPLTAFVTKMAERATAHYS